MKRTYIFAPFLFAGAMTLLAGGAAAADVYKCTVEARYTRGWFFPAYVFTHTPGEKQVMVQSYEANGDQFAQFPAKIMSEKGTKLRGRFDWNGARTATGSKIKVRYTATLDRKTLALKMSASVGSSGQRGFARGTCVRAD